MTARAIGTRISFLQALSQKRHVMTAVMLRDMRTRFFNHGLGFLIVALWPLAHMLILLAIYTVVGRKTPFGESLNVFFATGLIPTLAFMYVSRFMSLSLILNRPMLSFPVVTVVDIMTARAVLEIIAAYLTLIFMFAILLALGDDPIPFDVEQAVYAYLATLLLSVGVRVLGGCDCHVLSILCDHLCLDDDSGVHRFRHAFCDLRPPRCHLGPPRLEPGRALRRMDENRLLSHLQR